MFAYFSSGAAKPRHSFYVIQKKKSTFSSRCRGVYRAKRSRFISRDHYIILNKLKRKAIIMNDFVE